MRVRFFKKLYELMKKDNNIYALTGDLGKGGFDRIRDEIPDRFINCGASEQVMLDIAIGLSLSGKIPVVYSITPFLLYRPFESLRTYINHEKIQVIMVGSGRDDDYKDDGYSHHAKDAAFVLDSQPQIQQYYPESEEQMLEDLEEIFRVEYPAFLGLKR